jgi:hypothetical protein
MSGPVRDSDGAFADALTDIGPASTVAAMEDEQVDVLAASHSPDTGLVGRVRFDVADVDLGDHVRVLRGLPACRRLSPGR